MRRCVVWLSILLLCSGCGHGSDATGAANLADLEPASELSDPAQPIEPDEQSRLEAAMRTLEKLGNSPEWDAKCAAIRTIRAFGKKAELALPLLLNVLKDEKPDGNRWLVRSEAICALAAIGPETLPDIQAELQHPDLHVRQATAYALEQLASQSEAAAALLEDAVVDQTQPWLVRAEAARSLVAAGREAVGAFEAALKDENASVRATAAESLGRLAPDSRAAIPSLRAALADQDWLVRSAAVYALGQMGPEVIPDVLAAMQDKHSGVRLAAEHALRELRTENERAIQSALKRQNGAVRAAAARAMSAAEQPETPSQTESR